MNKKLNFWDCMGFCIGQIIGSGIMVLTGIVIGFTGHGTPFAFILAAGLAITTMIPFTFLASTLPANGAGYNYVKRLIGEKCGFFYLCSFVLTQVLIATYAKGFASYFVAIFPSFNETIIAMLALSIAVIVNLIGLKTSAVVQKIMVIFLLTSLGIFIAFGLPQVDWNILEFSKTNIMPNGIKSFLIGIALLSFATSGAKFIAENGDEIENPQKNIPKAMIFSTLLVAIFYAMIGVVASGVLPIEEVAFQNLTVVAKKIFSPAVYLFFVIGGAMFALMTTLNGTLSWVTRGLQAASKEGWLPEIFAKENKGGAPILLLIIFYIVGAFPILTGMSTEIIANIGIGLDMLTEFAILIACFRLPKLFPEEFKKSAFYIKPKILYWILSVVGILMLGTSYVNLSDLTSSMYIFIVIYLIFIYILTQFRYKYFLAKKNSIK
ncbi:APC family permease [Fusobacterium simiae]|uniref:APC family permease n=1 Tax=Fusobacterium simiae TaxID=855 RepID=A0ABT4DJ52_FUSSI|nr:APC family permease [Fusobacterium simiae]MCY7008637.1 APC family permease [Fusobacterium simiae]